MPAFFVVYEVSTICRKRIGLRIFFFSEISVGRHLTYLMNQVPRRCIQDLTSEQSAVTPVRSPRSGRQRKAWGVSPRIASRKAIKACEAGGSRII